MDPFENSTTENDTGKLIPFCKQVLLQDIGLWSVRVWDIVILVPNMLFMLFLIYKVKRIREKLAQKRSPVYTAFYLMVYITTFIAIVRAIVSMSVSAVNFDRSEVADKILWLILKFFTLSAELCVLTFGIFFGHLDSRTSIRRALCVTLMVALIFSTMQSLIEFKWPDQHYHSSKANAEIDLYSHGGSKFWLAGSALFFLIYTTVCVLPFTPLRRRVSLPDQRRFYYYCAFLAVLNALQVIGISLILTNNLSGMCLVDLTCYIYFALYTPLIYVTFLKGHADEEPSWMWSYRPQKDDEMADSGANYYPRFSGMMSPSYDDIFSPDSTAMDSAYSEQHTDSFGDGPSTSALNMIGQNHGSHTNMVERNYADNPLEPQIVGGVLVLGEEERQSRSRMV